MRKILAAIDTSAAAGPVLSTARAIAHLYNGEAEAIHVREGDSETVRVMAESAGIALRTFDGPPLEVLISQARDDEVAAIVVGARAVPLGKLPVGHVTMDVITSLRKPVVVVPPRASAFAALERVLVPLEGTRVSSAPMATVIEQARAHGLDVVLLHVREEREVPRFGDQPQHEMDAWAQEFLARHGACAGSEACLEVRVGPAGTQILRAIEETRANLLALSWAQDFAPERARVVRQCLAGSTIPVLLVPLAA